MNGGSIGKAGGRLLQDLRRQIRSERQKGEERRLLTAGEWMLIVKCMLYGLEGPCGRLAAVVADGVGQGKRSRWGSEVDD